MNGVFCISLDFEKFWGVHDVLPIDECQHFDTIDGVVTQTLKLFKRYDIHATWATVGLLHFSSIEELKQKNEPFYIPYANQDYSPFPLTSKKYGVFDPAILLGCAVIEKILSTENQELASHTYSHIYCCEAGISIDDFHADCERMQLVEKRLSHPFKSIIFPRNQIDQKALGVAATFGLIAYRGNQENRFWSNSTLKNESFLKKAGRVIDAYFKNSRTNAYKMADLPKTNGLINIPANRFFRPITSKEWLEKRKIRRIKEEMFTAAKNGTIYHLWWHPHNFSQNLEIGLVQMEELFAYFQVLKDKFDFRSMTMSEIAADGER